MKTTQGEPRFPNVQWGRRHPVKQLAWRLAWWLMRRVTMRGYTPYQQARTIDNALGAYRPKSMVVFDSPPTTTSGGENVTVRYKPTV